MSVLNRYSLALAAVSIAATACSSNSLRVASAGDAPRLCPGGAIRAPADVQQYAGCSDIAGDLRIEGAKITDLAPLGGLRTVHGALVVSHDPELSDLSGLESLASVERLEIDGNRSLSSIAALGRLTHAPVVRIRNSPRLESLHGLESLSAVESLELTNAGVVETSGLSGLRQVGELSVTNNVKLISLRGLNGVTHARTVRIEKNRLICAQLGFLPQLSAVSESLVLSANSSLSREEVQGLLQRVKYQPSPLLSRGLALH